MTRLPWVGELADRFWEWAGEVEPIPRSLRDSIALALPLDVVELPQLTLQSALAWLSERGIDWPSGEPDRRLHGALLAWRGQGFAFVEANDEESERTFSLAHELAHFLRDYLQPRLNAQRLLGPAILEVLDGDRPASSTESLHAVLHRLRLGYHTHLLARGARTEEVERAEEEADRLAWELLAPVQEVARLCPQGTDRRAVTACLVQTFGLPLEQARRYVAQLVPSPRPAHPLLARLAWARKVEKGGPGDPLT